MSWTDQLRDASFKGVPIRWLTLGGKNGRRLAEHEFPQRDRPWVEDMGRITRPYRFTAVCAGDDWLKELNRLLTVIEEPGAGELIHPLFGRVKVYAKPAEWQMSIDEGRWVSVDLEFTENGDLLFPVSIAQTQAAVTSSKASMIETAQSKAEEALSKLDLAKAKVSAVVKAVSSAISSVSRYVSGVVSYFKSWQSLVNTVLTLPATAISSILSVLDTAKDGFTSLTDLTAWGIDQSAALKTLKKRAAALTGSASSDSASVSTKVAAIIVETLVSALVANTVATVTELPTTRSTTSTTGDNGSATDDVSSSDAPVADDVAVLRTSLSDTLWAVAEGVDYDTAAAVLEVRRDVVAHLQVAESIGLKLKTVTTRSVVPALVLAYQAQGNAKYATELIQRNKVIHPLFVPAGNVQVTYD